MGKTAPPHQQFQGPERIRHAGGHPDVEQAPQGDESSGQKSEDEQLVDGQPTLVHARLDGGLRDFPRGQEIGHVVPTPLHAR